MGKSGRGRVIPGFIISNCGLPASYSIQYDDMLQEHLETSKWAVARRTFKRFLNDKTLYEDEDCLIALEGVILNKRELYGRYGASSVEELVKVMRSCEGVAFFKDFRGSFSGAYFDRESSIWTVWTNHYGNSEVFYYAAKGYVIIGSNFWDVLNAVKGRQNISIDETAVLSMLTYGGMNDNQTYVREVKRLLPGHYLTIDSYGQMYDHTYWSISHDLYDLHDCPEQEIIEGLDRLFRRAVDRQFSKDSEYGFRHLAELSGGLDSRMISWVAHDLGYSDVVNMTFCQSGYLDEVVAKKLSTDLGNQFMFMPMDDAGFVKDVDETIALNFGLTIYSGTTGLRRFLENMNTAAFGLIHSGTTGDVIVGSYLHDPSESKDEKPGGLYSTLLHDEVQKITEFSLFNNQEDYLLFTRGFLIIATSDLIRRGYSDVASPFLDIDFFDYCMSIPLEYRCGHKLYKKWICSCYPEAAQYIWEKQGAPVSAGKARVWFSGKIRALSVLGARGAVSEIMKRLGMLRGSQKSGILRGGMNPFDYWFAAHPSIRQALDSMYSSDLDVVQGLSERVCRDISKVYYEGTAQETTLAITALHTIRMIMSA
ncbi:asparagine synthase-related protein [Enorma phocaeensis]|uniref:asparagine synthase-related protein n=1 Tax=Enorma phocaeensis TaxID=1871019 RepID=UPI0032086E04